MKTFAAEIIAEIQPFSHRLSHSKMLTNVFWILVDNNKMKAVYLFGQNNELWITKQGEVEKGRWKYAGDNSFHITHQKHPSGQSFSHGFFDHEFLVVKVNGHAGYAFFIHGDLYNKGINSVGKVIDALRKKYISYSPDDMQQTGRPEFPVLDREKLPAYPKINKDILIFRRPFWKALFSRRKYGEIIINKKTNKAYFKKRSKKEVVL